MLNWRTFARTTKTTFLAIAVIDAQPAYVFVKDSFVNKMKTMNIFFKKKTLDYTLVCSRKMANRRAPLATLFSEQFLETPSAVLLFSFGGSSDKDSSAMTGSVDEALTRNHPDDASPPIKPESTDDTPPFVVFSEKNK